MHHTDRVLAKIRCPASRAALDPLISKVGLRTKKAAEEGTIHIVNSTRTSEPEVDKELLELAFEKLRSAHASGNLPQWSIVE